MAGTAEIAANGRGRASATKIVLAGDRTVSRKLARRHSQTVRILKFALPLSAVGTLAIFMVSLLKHQPITSGLPDLQMPEVVADNLKMKNPHYEGFNQDGGKYWVKADSAQQDIKSLTVIRLEGISGELTDASKQKTFLTATRGLFDTKANDLELFDAIDVKGENGLSAKLTRASVKTKESIITSNEPVDVAMQAGTITSNQMTIRQKTKEYTFVDSVKMQVTPKEPAPGEAGAAQNTSLPFGKPGKPIDITANRLDIDDEKKSALFTGGVVASQDGASLTAPEMTITYEGAVGPENGADQNAQGKLKQIFAKDSVTMQQQSGETATSRTAAFDAENHTVVLDGDVVLSQGTDKKAVGDRAEYDQAAQTMVLTGPVVVTQAGNELRGRRLQFNRDTGKVQLTASTPGTTGRVTARFVKTALKPEAKGNSDDDESSAPPTDGIPFGQAFKTDPSAPVSVSSTRLDVDDKAKSAVFTGDVRAQQGDFTITAQELVASYVGNVGLANAAQDGAPKTLPAQLSTITARKKVMVSSNKGGQKAVGDWGRFDVKANMATLGGDVTLTQGRNVVKGTKLLIDMNTGQSTIKTEPANANGGGAMISSSDGDGSGQIVRSSRPSAVFYPNQVLGDHKKKHGSDDASGWSAKTSP